MRFSSTLLLLPASTVVFAIPLRERLADRSASQLESALNVRDLPISGEILERYSLDQDLSARELSSIQALYVREHQGDGHFGRELPDSGMYYSRSDSKLGEHVARELEIDSQYLNARYHELNGRSLDVAGYIMNQIQTFITFVNSLKNSTITKTTTTTTTTTIKKPSTPTIVAPTPVPSSSSLVGVVDNKKAGAGDMDYRSLELEHDLDARDLDYSQGGLEERELDSGSYPLPSKRESGGSISQRALDQDSLDLDVRGQGSDFESVLRRALNVNEYNMDARDDHSLEARHIVNLLPIRDNQGSDYTTISRRGLDELNLESRDDYNLEDRHLLGTVFHILNPLPRDELKRELDSDGNHLLFKRDSDGSVSWRALDHDNLDLDVRGQGSDFESVSRRALNVDEYNMDARDDHSLEARHIVNLLPVRDNQGSDYTTISRRDLDELNLESRGDYNLEDRHLLGTVFHILNPLPRDNQS